MRITIFKRLFKVEKRVAPSGLEVAHNTNKSVSSLSGLHLTISMSPNVIPEQKNIPL